MILTHKDFYPEAKHLPTGFAPFNENPHLAIDLSKAVGNHTISVKLPNGECVTLALVSYNKEESDPNRFGCVDIQHHHKMDTIQTTPPWALETQQHKPVSRVAQQYLAFTGGFKSYRGVCSLLTLLLHPRHHTKEERHTEDGIAQICSEILKVLPPEWLYGSKVSLFAQLKHLIENAKTK